jgi:hypothetical protein
MNSITGDFIVTEECQEFNQCELPNAVSKIEDDAFTLYPNPVNNKITLSGADRCGISVWKCMTSSDG